MNILIITHQYPQLNKSNTTVIQDFSKEFVELGHKVVVLHVRNNYRLIKYIPKPIILYLESKFDKRIEPFNKSIEIDKNILIIREPINKFFFTETGHEKIKGVYDTISSVLDEINFEAEKVLVHWFKPYHKIGLMFSKKYKASNSIVIHSLQKLKDKDIKLISNYDKIGFRSISLQDKFRSLVNSKDLDGKYYLCLSGINISGTNKRVVTGEFKNFIFVGAMIQRKYPHLIIPALNNSKLSYKELKFIGKGHLLTQLKKQKKTNNNARLKFYGSLKQEQVYEHMDNSDCLIMISKDEAFGLVYLEAMLRSCIVIGSIGEGIDGIIKHGQNGFLCNPGDLKNLEDLLLYISKLSPRERLIIKKNARKTAMQYSKSKMALKYLSNIK